MTNLLKTTILFIFLSFTQNYVVAANYVGSESCAICHAQQYNHFRVSGHPYKLTKAEVAKHRALPLPKGYSWDDISYVIGGAYKKVRYIDKQGFIITAAKDGSELKTQYNLETGTWSFYHKGEKKPYTCGGCHTTGFSKKGHQDGLKGIKGTWAATGIQCEACHGPGSQHVKNGDKKLIKIDRSAASCGSCHSRGDIKTIPAKKGFIRHHEQYNELLASPHKAMNCVTCHNPHKRAQFSIKINCASCHNQVEKTYLGSSMQKVGVRCIDCHMPKATKSATAKSTVEADIRSHLFKINTTGKKMFYDKQKKEKTKSFANGFVTPDFACLSCHKDKTKQWATEKSKNIHKAGK